MKVTGYKRKTHYLGAADVQSIETIKERYGLSTDSDAVRLALRLVAEGAVQVKERQKKRA